MLRKTTALAGLAAAIVLLAGPSASAQLSKAEKARQERLKKGGKEKKPVRISFRAEVDPFSDANSLQGVRRGGSFTVSIIGTPEPGFYTYTLKKRAPGQDDGSLAKIRIQASPDLDPLEPWSESEPELVTIPTIGSQLRYTKEFVWQQDVFVNEQAEPGSTHEIAYTLDIQVCDQSCYLETHKAEAKVKVSDEPALVPTPALDKRERSPRSSGDKPKAVGEGKKKGQTTFFGAIIVALLGGFVSLLTPCVFPMIPVTVSIFLKQSETKQGSAVLLATVYSGTIVLVMALGGLLLLQFLSAVINHWITNLVLGLVFLYFALSLLGMYDITLPSWLQDMTHSGEGKGGMAGVFFMALTFSIISFACVGPIYGGFLSAEANASVGSGGFLRRLFSVLAFSIAFASPFFLLALFPSWLKTLPKAGSWMNSVKVVMGFLELAAMVKFLRGAELLLHGQTTILTYQVSMGLYVAICLACALYLFGVYMLPHDHGAPESISVTRLLFAMSFLMLGFYLTPGVFPLKDEDIPARGKVYAWVDSFLLPDPKKGAWMSDLDAALAQARNQNKLVFLDITGVNCTNCKLNERNIFPRPEVQKAFEKHVLLKLYTDTVPAGTNQNPTAPGAIVLRTEKFQSEALPLYALLRPTT
ncbi:MAG: thioredoxin family protein, partial [Gemmataceae bacterium]|nr:thioredoxin family protein [Gemmataceae bacterium]